MEVSLFPDGEGFSKSMSRGDLLFHQCRDKHDIACKPVQLGDHERASLATAEAKRFGQGWPVVSLAAFDLNDFPDKRPSRPR